MDLYATVEAFIAKLKEQFVAAKADGVLSAGEAFGLFTTGIRLLVEEAAKLSELSGPDKKALVVAAALKLYDTLIAPIDIPWVPGLVEGKLDALAKSLLEDAIEAVYAAFKLERAA